MLHDPLGLVRSLRSGVKVRRWIRVSVTLAAVVAGVTALGAPGARLIDARQVQVARLPWGHVTVNGRQLGPMKDSSMLLYVLPSCSHCDSAVRIFADALPRAAFEGLVIAGSGRDDSDAYRRRFGLAVIGTDSLRMFARGAGIQLVPTLISLRESVAVVTPVPSPQWLRRELAAR